MNYRATPTLLLEGKGVQGMRSLKNKIHDR